MPNIEFLEEYPLYRKFEYNLPSSLDGIKDVNINMYCPFFLEYSLTPAS